MPECPVLIGQTISRYPHYRKARRWSCGARFAGLRVERFWDTLRSDPWFAAVLQRIGIPP
jgi:hypothetical protein